MSDKLVCWRCGEPLRKDIPRPFPRLEKCRVCESDLHVCVLCRHYAPHYTSPCDHDFAEPPLQRETANFCKYFKPKSFNFSNQRLSKAEEAQASLAALFDGTGSGEGDRPKDEDEAMAKLHDLFGTSSDEHADKDE